MDVGAAYAEHAWTWEQHTQGMHGCGSSIRRSCMDVGAAYATHAWTWEQHTFASSSHSVHPLPLNSIHNPHPRVCGGGGWCGCAAVGEDRAPRVWLENQPAIQDEYRAGHDPRQGCRRGTLVHSQHTAFQQAFQTVHGTTPPASHQALPLLHMWPVSLWSLIHPWQLASLTKQATLPVPRKSVSSSGWVSCRPNRGV